MATTAIASSADLADPEFLRRYTETYRFTLGRPTAIRVAPGGDAVFFLRSGPRSFVRDLYVYDPGSRTERLLLYSARLLGGAEETLTPEERARRERKRLAARGIASYQLSRDGRRILVPLSGRLFVLERATGKVRELTPDSSAADEARFSPDGERVACVRGGDLRVIEIGSGEERRLTRREDEEVTHGLAEFVAQEEMGRHEGYWWSPDSRWIAYQRTDTRGVERLHIADPAHPQRAPDSWPYPRAGQANAEVRLGVVAAEGGPTTWVQWDTKRYPYLAKVTWEQNAPLAILVQNREQTEELLLAVDHRTGRTTRMLVEKDAAWLNLHDRMPLWLPEGDRFLWVTERRGWPELELRDRGGRLVSVLTRPALNLREVLHVDVDRGTAWVLAGEEPTEAHLYRVPLRARDGAPRRVTEGPGVHAATFPERGARAYVLETKNLAGAWRHEVLSPEGSSLGLLRSVAEEPDFLPNLALETLPGPSALRAAIVRPRDLQPERRYPVIVHVYGGPLSQMVRADRRKYLLDQWVADHGYVVVCLDGRGTPARGRLWERAIRGDFVSAPLADQAAGLAALGRRHPEMDLSRVGIWGWSFGGYFSALAVMRRPDVFHSAVAGAPVVDWRHYDTHYTERYLGLPATRPQAYERSSVAAAASELARPLLIVHGTADDNVYFLHSLALCDALNRAGKNYDFLPLVGHTHMLSDAQANLRLYTRLIEHFGRTLGAPPGAAAPRASRGR
jgi:dipeptidyl-peptidase-4